METNKETRGAQLADNIVRALVGDRLADKYAAVEALGDTNLDTALPLLRARLLNLIQTEFDVGRETELVDPEIGDTRSWLLGALGVISGNDAASTDLVVRYLDPQFETHQWARFWSLEGLIRGSNPRVADLARGLSERTDDPMVSMLATAYLGSLRDAKAIRTLRDALGEPQTKWYALRALRVVPLAAAVVDLCKIVDTGEYSDEMYDAIMALGSVPLQWAQAEMAAQSLSACIVELRGRPWKDGMRTGAISGLGKLAADLAAPVLIDELLDDNPAIVREAARSLQRILGLQLSVARIVEAAAKGGQANTDTWGRALRWLDRDATAEELGTLMASGAPNQREIARVLLSEIGGPVAFEKLRARTDALKQYTDVLAAAEEKIRVLFDRTIREAQTGFQVSTYMDLTIFGLGVLLLAISAGRALFSDGSLDSWAGIGATAGVGVLGVLYGTLIAQPRKQIVESVDHLMSMKIMFLAYLRRLHQADQAFTRRMLDEVPLKIEELERFSEVVAGIMASTIGQQPGRGRQPPVSSPA